MDTRAFLQNQFAFSHNVLEQVIAPCDQATLDKTYPGGQVTTIGAIYAHAVMSEDAMVHGMILSQPPLLQAQGWAERLGVPLPGGGMEHEWGRTFKLPAAFRDYATAVHAATLAALGRATPADLARELKGPLGPQPAAAIYGLALTHLWGHLGEIAALKGIQGQKGLPF